MVDFCTRRAPCIQRFFAHFLTFFRTCTVFRGLYGTPFACTGGFIGIRGEPSRPIDTSIRQPWLMLTVKDARGM